MRSWITFIGSSPFAVINTIWAACKVDNYVPDRLVFLVNKELKEEWIDVVMHWVPLILDEYGVKEPVIDTHEVEETDFKTIMDVYDVYLSLFRKTGQAAVDITPGRKYMSAIAMEAGLSGKADHVYYLHLLDSCYQNNPYPLIPKSRHTLIDMKHEFTEFYEKSKGGEV